MARNTVQDAQETEHGRVRGIAHALRDHLLIADGQLAEPAAEGACGGYPESR